MSLRRQEGCRGSISAAFACPKLLSGPPWPLLVQGLPDTPRTEDKMTGAEKKGGHSESPQARVPHYGAAVGLLLSRVQGQLRRAAIWWGNPCLLLLLLTCPFSGAFWGPGDSVSFARAPSPLQEAPGGAVPAADRAGLGRPSPASVGLRPRERRRRRSSPSARPPARPSPPASARVLMRHFHSESAGRNRGAANSISSAVSPRQPHG